MKKLIISIIVALLSLSCSISTPDNSSPSPQTSLLGGAGVGSLHSSFDFSDLEKEYKSFSTKALSDAYVSRIFTKFLTTSPNSTQVIRQLEFARYLKDVKSDPGYFNSLKNFIGGDTAKFNLINNTSGVTQKKTSEPTTFGTFVDSLNPNQAPTGFISIQGGTLTLGTLEFPTAHQVTLSNFYLGRYEVTQSEWNSIYNAPNTTVALKTLMVSSNPSNFTGNNLPVERVNWWQAIAYCNAKSIADGLPVAYNTTTGELLNGISTYAVTTDTTQVKGYRLPTEAEWEFAARGGNSTHEYTYSGSNNVDLVTVYGTSGTATVGSKTPNELGIYDMSGNVWEWVQDYYVSPYSSDVVTNPYISSGGSNRVLRGGGWYNGANYARVSYRNNIYPSYSGDFQVGFRVCRSAN